MKVGERVYAYEKPGMGGQGSHTYVVTGDRLTALIDPGFIRNFRELVAAEMVEDGITLEDVDIVLNTHFHTDHSEADGTVADDVNADITLHRSQVDFLDMDVSAHPAFSVPKAVDRVYEDEIDLGGITLDVVETPGHAPGHVCFYLPEMKTVISGDLIFEKNVGRFDLPGGDEEKERDSVERISEMDIDKLLPGHGKMFLSRDEVRENIRFVLDRWERLE